MTEERLRLGKQGEEVAARYLAAQGMKILERNLRTPLGEIDLVARYKTMLVFVEVKTRRSHSFGLPQEAVGTRKQRQILRSAQWYLAAGNGSGLQPRFDVVAVLVAGETVEIEHLPDAFGLDG
ncbi:MAG: YraN family protein [Desulfuromonas sp.]|nr:MAG: YraN family protein [Desulfuromonas sp.]